MRRLLLLSFVSLAGCAAATDLMNAAVDAAGAAQTANTPAVAASWETAVTEYRDRVGARVAFDCPAGGSEYTIWGTDVYSDDSSVCTAGVHMGLISFARGGRVVLQIKSGQSSYSGTTRNGVQSEPYGAWEGSFSFVR
ncbi:MAG TPA: LCCL domain-containing protein [Rubricoccaceae bacterium]